MWSHAHPLSRKQVAYQRILQLTYVDELLAALKTLFIKLFEPFLATFLASLHAVDTGKAVESSVSWNFARAFDNWDNLFDKLLASLEGKASQVSYSSISHAHLFDSLSKDRKARAKPIHYQNVEPSAVADEIENGLYLFVTTRVMTVS